MQIPDELRARLESGPGGGRDGVIAGLRPERLRGRRARAGPRHRHTFTAKIDVLESMGSEFYAYFDVESERVSAAELEETGRGRRARRPPRQEGTQIVARLESASKVRQGEELELWFNSEHLHLFDPETGRSLLAE